MRQLRAQISGLKLPRANNSLQIGPAIELIIADAFWGFGFIAVLWAIPAVGPFTISLIRFVGAFVIGMAIWIFSSEFRSRDSVAQFRLALIPGILLASTILFQTWGLKFTTATKSGFITCLYVVMVPLVEGIVLRRPIRRLHYLFAALAVLGTSLIADLQFHKINFGDLLTLICAVMATFQILWLGHVGSKVKHPFAFNSYQCFWAAVPALPLALTTETWPHLSLFTWKVWAGLGSLTLGSTVLAFFLQVRAQQRLSPSVASLLFLLESPFAALFAALVLRESLTWSQAIGAGLIFIASLGAICLSNPHRTDR